MEVVLSQVVSVLQPDDFRNLGVFFRPQGTDIGRGSAVDHHQTVFVNFAAAWVQSDIFDDVLSRRHKLFSCIGVHFCTFYLVNCSVLVFS